MIRALFLCWLVLMAVYAIFVAVVFVLGGGDWQTYVIVVSSVSLINLVGMSLAALKL